MENLTIIQRVGINLCIHLWLEKCVHCLLVSKPSRSLVCSQVKMDTYLIVNAVQLGKAIAPFSQTVSRTKVDQVDYQPSKPLCAGTWNVLLCTFRTPCMGTSNWGKWKKFSLIDLAPWCEDIVFSWVKLVDRRCNASTKPMNYQNFLLRGFLAVVHWLHSPPGFTVMAFCEGRLASGTPTWLVGCHTLSLAGPRSLPSFLVLCCIKPVKILWECLRPFF